MPGVKLLVLFSSLWGSGIGLNNTQHSWTVPEDENSTSGPRSKVPSLPGLGATKTSAEALEAPGTRPSGDSLRQSTLQPSETSASLEGLSSQTLTPPGKTGGPVAPQSPAFPSKSSIKPSPGAGTAVLSDATLKFLQSFAGKPDPQAMHLKSAGDTANRSPRGTSLSRGDRSGRQRPGYQKPSFETTRGKNWCAYVHTRLSPTVILDNLGSYVPNGRGPCGWNSASCPQRSQKTPSAVYKMQHKIVTSLEWKCCPGYSGPTCQLTAQEQQQLTHRSQAESHTAVDGGTAEQPQQHQDCGDPAVIQKLTDQMNHQAGKLSLLQKEVDNVSLAVGAVRNAYFSLEEKIGEEKDMEFRSFLKGLKSKSIDDLVKDIVREQFKVFQNDMQETIAQLFKTVSSLSEDLESTRQAILQVNQSVVSLTVQQKSALMHGNRPTLKDIADLQTSISDIRQEMALKFEKPIKELEAQQAYLEGALEQERSRDIQYYESLNKTLSKMQESHEQLLSMKQVSHQEYVTTEGSVSDNITYHISVLQEKVSKQDLMMLQMFNDLHIQESKIRNLTTHLEMEKASVRGECEEMLSKCRNDFKFQLKDTEENLHMLNQTLAEVIFPMDNKVDKMSEQLNDLTYDMEILQPLLEQRSSLTQRVTHNGPREAAVSRKELQSLISAVNRLNILIKELSKRHSLLRNEVQSRSEAFQRRLSDHALDMEDSLNKTMTVVNNAIDFVQDNYVLKETLRALNDNPKVHECNQNMEAILTFIPQFQRLNDSIQTLVNDNQKYNFVLQVAKALAAVPKDEKLSQINVQKIYQMFNETTSKVKKYQQNMSNLEELIFSATKIPKKFEAQLQGLESKVTKTLIPYYSSFKKDNMMSSGRDHTLQLHVLNSRFKALEAKSIHLSASFSLLNKTVHELLTTCHNASTSACRPTAVVPMWTQGSLPDSQAPQKALTEFVESIIEIKTHDALANLTWNVDRLLSDSLANVAKSQKQVKLQKKPNTLKKSVNGTTVLIGRAQRNTDSIKHPAQEYSGCSGFPCQNGGTCISGMDSFTCACRHPFTGGNCTVKVVEENALAPDFSKGSYRYAPMVAFFVSHTYGMTTPGPILFNNLAVNYGASYNPSTGKFRIPYLGVYVFKYTIESFSAHISGFLVVDGIDKLTFESENLNSEIHCDRVLTGDALLELNYGQEVWLRLVKGTIPAKNPPVSTFSGYLLYRT
ncbi:multimerin-1 [Nannospalax galili]|uniref:Multimerin 1 n=1 Tax=Nannospalax galili TaxID=1026970 RepID=A0A8C6R150_NANGA|nr:multimerin-1 [Nannospalax galili]